MNVSFYFRFYIAEAIAMSSHVTSGTFYVGNHYHFIWKRRYYNDSNHDGLSYHLKDIQPLEIIKILHLCADAQADLCICCLHMHKRYFLMPVL